MVLGRRSQVLSGTCSERPQGLSTSRGTQYLVIPMPLPDPNILAYPGPSSGIIHLLVFFCQLGQSRRPRNGLQEQRLTELTPTSNGLATRPQLPLNEPVNN